MGEGMGQVSSHGFMGYRREDGRVGTRNHVVVLSVLGLVLARLYAKFKSGKHQAYAIHLFYWNLPRALSPLRRCPPSDLREFVG